MSAKDYELILCKDGQLYINKKDGNDFRSEDSKMLSEADYAEITKWFKKYGEQNLEEPKEYSCIETIYRCGKKPHWKKGDILAFYEFCSDREGEYVLGKVTKVEFNEEQCDWIYTFEEERVYEEESLLEYETYKKN